ncbi:MAG: hypothetical protein AAB778_02400 [Patescibacteria group bacterium]
MNTLQNFTTVTELQRNFKNVSDQAKRLNDALIVFSNSNPHGVYIDYQTFLNKYEEKSIKKNITKTKKDNDFSEFLGLWTKEEFNEFNKSTDEMFEKVDVDMWK